MDIESVADELYARPREEFIRTRDEFAAQARSNGDRALAAEIKALRKPTTAAWLVNRLAREHGKEIARLGKLGQDLRSAHHELAGAKLRTLSRKRHDLLRSLVETAQRMAEQSGQGASESVASEVEATLSAALSDPGLAAEVAAGRLSGAITATSDQWLTAALAASTGPAATKSERKPAPEREARQGLAPPKQSGRDRAAGQRRRAELDQARRKVADAETARREAERVVGGLERSAARAKEKVTNLRARLTEAERAERASRRELYQARKTLDAAAREAAAAQSRLEELGRLEKLE